MKGARAFWRSRPLAYWCVGGGKEEKRFAQPRVEIGIVGGRWDLCYCARMRKVCIWGAALGWCNKRTGRRVGCRSGAGREKTSGCSTGGVRRGCGGVGGWAEGGLAQGLEEGAGGPMYQA